MTKYKELLQNWERLEELLQKPLANKDKVTTEMIKRYSDQNLDIINEVLLSSIDHLHRLHKTQSLNDIICVQARLSDEIGKKVVKATQQFFNASLHQVSDYNEWLRAHCDFATD